MQIFNFKLALNNFLKQQKSKAKTIGFVPTMGALHQGHLSLIKRAKTENNLVVVSIFVNPTQFDNKKDLKKYPKSLNEDIRLLQEVKCDILFVPSIAEIYSDKVRALSFDFDGLENIMEGRFRKNHFNGVATIVKTLFEIVEPTTAYFGKKDFQQLQIIKKLVKKYSIPILIKGGSIYREKDGLAMSSRNAQLTKEQRVAVPFIYKTLKEVKEKFKTQKIEELTHWVEKQFSKHNTLNLEYFTIAEEESLQNPKNIEVNKKYRAFIAVFAGDIRLIDNIGLCCACT
ncbi:MAG: pantoate--beta-alanine ligase [Tenacibaculum sp.]